MTNKTFIEPNYSNLCLATAKIGLDYLVIVVSALVIVQHMEQLDSAGNFFHVFN